MCDCSTCVPVASGGDKLPVEMRRGCWSPWNKNYSCFGAFMWVLGIETGSSPRATGSLHCWTPFSYPFHLFFKAGFLFIVRLFLNLWSPCLSFQNAGMVGQAIISDLILRLKWRSWLCSTCPIHSLCLVNCLDRILYRNKPSFVVPGLVRRTIFHYAFRIISSLQ